MSACAALFLLIVAVRGSSQGDRVAAAAASQVGPQFPYSWGGGNANGPTAGTTMDQDPFCDDTGVVGYDCSGLALYAVFQGTGLKYADTRGVHVPFKEALPGDLVFYSKTGLASGIYHHTDNPVSTDVPVPVAQIAATADAVETEDVKTDTNAEERPFVTSVSDTEGSMAAAAPATSPTKPADVAVTTQMTRADCGIAEGVPLPRVPPCDWATDGADISDAHFFELINEVGTGSKDRIPAWTVDAAEVLRVNGITSIEFTVFCPSVSDVTMAFRTSGRAARAATALNNQRLVGRAGTPRRCAAP
eukprot:m51a1_g13917 hypothetical protein (304) ;mRNA; f:798888-809418